MSEVTQAGRKVYRAQALLLGPRGGQQWLGHLSGLVSGVFEEGASPDPGGDAGAWRQRQL